MKKLTVNEQEELFAQDCKLINLRYEYSGFTGTEKWAIITELSEEALWDKYPDVISRYTPFILLSMAQGEVISESHRNNDKYEKRSKRTKGRICSIFIVSLPLTDTRILSLSIASEIRNIREHSIKQSAA